MKLEKISKSVYLAYSESSNATYKISINPEGKCFCQCKGFAFRQSCKHVTEVYKLVSKSKERKVKKPVEKKLDKSIEKTLYPYQSQLSKLLNVTV